MAHQQSPHIGGCFAKGWFTALSLYNWFCTHHGIVAGDASLLWPFSIVSYKCYWSLDCIGSIRRVWRLNIAGTIFSGNTQSALPSFSLVPTCTFTCYWAGGSVCVWTYDRNCHSALEDSVFYCLVCSTVTAEMPEGKGEIQSLQNKVKFSSRPRCSVRQGVIVPLVSFWSCSSIDNSQKH